MKDTYYTLPLQLGNILQKKYHPACSLKESIAQNLYIILTTHFQESRYNPGFGCAIWEEDFEIMSTVKWKDKICASFEETVRVHEKRLTNIRVRIEIDEFEFSSIHNRRVKRRVGIWIEGFLLKTNEKFDFFERLYISPLSLD